MFGETNLQKLISTMTPILGAEEYVFSTQPEISEGQLTALSPIGTFREKEGVTLILLKSVADQYGVKYSGVFRCITLNVHSSLDAVGLTAAVSTKLTQKNISANVVAGYFHDHIFVSYKDADRALSALLELVEEEK